jgi:hypothetical protein
MTNACLAGLVYSPGLRTTVRSDTHLRLKGVPRGHDLQFHRRHKKQRATVVSTGITRQFLKKRYFSRTVEAITKLTGTD